MAVILGEPNSVAWRWAGDGNRDAFFATPSRGSFTGMEAAGSSRTAVLNKGFAPATPKVLGLNALMALEKALAVMMK